MRYMHTVHMYTHQTHVCCASRTGLPSAIVTDAVVAHFAFGAQKGMHGATLFLARYRGLAKNASVHADLRRRFGGRTLSTSCASTPPPHMLGRRIENPCRDACGENIQTKE